MNKKIVITGLGAVTPLGVGVETFWNNLTSGKCAIGEIKSIDVSTLPVKNAGQVWDFNPKDYLPTKLCLDMEPYMQFAYIAAEEAIKQSGLDQIITAAYHLLGLQTFFTAGADECRAWTIHKGDKAPKAAGVIHSDFEKGFIRAEVIKYDDFVKYKTEAAVRAAGKMGVEGKDYVVQDGDIMHFLFNV